jgi:hypothetical protein
VRKKKVYCRRIRGLGAELAPPLKEAPKSVLLYLAGVAGKRCCFTGRHSAWTDCVMGMTLLRDAVKSQPAMVKLDDVLSANSMAKSVCADNKSCLEGVACVFKRINNAFL